MSQILFGDIPQLPSPPPKKSTTHSGNVVDNSTRTDLQKEGIRAYGGPILPCSTPNSCFDLNWRHEFKEFIKEAMAESQLFYGYRPTLFEHRSRKTELDAADCVLTNIINPILEICQSWTQPGYKLIVSSQAYHLPDGAVGGYIDHGIFLVRDDCQSLDKGAEKVIVDRVPSDPMEWMAVVVIEEKVFGTVQPGAWDQTVWEKKLAPPTRRSRTNKRRLPRTQLRLEDMNLIVRSILPQLRKYSDIFRRENIMLTDYHTSVAISIAPSNAARLSPALPIQVANCSTIKTWDGEFPLGDIFEYGPRLTLAYLIWHALTTRHALRPLGTSNMRLSKHRK